VATHDLDLAEGLLDQVAVLRDGRLLRVPPSTTTLRERYREAVLAAAGDAVTAAGAREARA